MFRTILRLSIAVLLMFGFVAAAAQASPYPHSHKLTLRVLADLSTFDIVPGSALGGTPFAVTGMICEETAMGGPCTPIGDFQCWGWLLASGDAVVSQEYHLFDRGKIQVQGLEDEGKRAVVGGTKAFKNVRGQATAVNLAPFPPEFTINFRLIGSGR